MRMEENKKMLLLVLHVALFQVCVVGTEKCPSFSHKNLSCYNDYVRNITCTYTSDHTDNVCTIQADMIMFSPSRKGDSTSCKLESTDVSRPELKKCSLNLKRTFKSFTTFSLRLRCVRGQTQNSDTCYTYKPVEHIKLAPPEKPNVNGTTVSWKSVVWVPQTGQEFELQWKREDESWSDPSVKKEMKQKQCGNCAAELNPDSLIQDESYRVRIRVRVKAPGTSNKSAWSDWSPTASWVSLVGRIKEKQNSDAPGVWWFIAAAVAVFSVFLVLIFKADSTTWVIKWIKGPPLPSFLQDEKLQKWQSSFFTSESYLSFLKPLDIASVEVTYTVDNIAPCKQELLPLDKSIRDCSQESSSSSFSNPSYSQLCPVPPICSLSAGNLEPCAADSPYGPAGGHGQSTNLHQDVEKQRGKDVDIMQVLSKANNREPLLEISDYEKVEKLQVERDRLQSVDSGMCSGEEVSQESLEPDSITQSHDEEPESKKQWEEGKGDCFQKLFGRSNTGDGFSKGSIEVCSDYEQVQKLQVEIPDDVSVDSDLGISREQRLSRHHILSTPSTCSLSDPPSTVLLLPSFTPSPLNFTRPGSSPGPGPLAALIGRTVMSNNSSLEPSADGYLPVTQEER